MRSLRILVASSLATVMAGQGVAQACTISIPAEFETDLRSECREVLLRKAQTLWLLQERELAYEDIAPVAYSFAQGKNRCPQNRELAFELYDAAAGPLFDLLDGWRLRELHAAAQNAQTADPQRKRAIAFRDWLVNDTFQQGFMCNPGRYEDRLPDGWSEAETRAEFLRPGNWDRALKTLGQNPARDRMIVEAVKDRTSPYYSPLDALSYGLQIRDPELRLSVARLVTDTGYGPPDYDAAAKLLDWYSPYIANGLDAAANAEAANIWRRIAQNRLASEDAAVRARAEAVLATGDPQAFPATDRMALVPAEAELTSLDWQDVAPDGPPAAMATALSRNYPARALRSEEAGVVQVGALFDTSGAYAGMRVLHSAGEQLDRATTTAFERYWRPRIKDVALEPAASWRLIELPPIEWRIGAASAEYVETGEFRDGRFVVEVSARVRPSFDYVVP
ncbi:energy transducer TonB [Parerythrobacter lacustris]|uniref:Energy transducer TonB n=1 Tax=Parerythrobacter lacustris TaxID=2969984 RepID=A0ABT1XT47_9SPHN|nr:energy transducer TonB [Parerythrobacter lacustris]MCR2834801.1 energy transducer TonB [Parerythrobacter lacustris]